MVTLAREFVILCTMQLLFLACVNMAGVIPPRLSLNLYILMRAWLGFTDTAFVVQRGFNLC
jgi:hypothetical protein